MDASRDEEAVEAPEGVLPEQGSEDTVAKVRTNIWLRRDLHEKVQAYATEEDMSVADVIRKALKDLLQKEGRA